MAELIDFTTRQAIEKERCAINRELTALAERARKAGLTSVGHVIDLLIAQSMEDEWPREPDKR